MKYIILILSAALFACMPTKTSTIDETLPDNLKGESVKETFVQDIQDIQEINESTFEEELEVIETHIADILDTAILDTLSEEVNSTSYPPGPYSLDLFNILPNMSFYDPWTLEWFELSSLYKHEETKAFILVSSAGWCGPCIKEAAALIDVYEKYNEDGLEIIYTLGNTNQPFDVPFDTTIDKPLSAGYAADLGFMEGFQNIVQGLADKKLNYKMYADPNREFIEYTPGHAWPYSLLITTKDMGVRLVTEGYWSALMENKIMMVLYNEVPNLPLE